MWFNILLNRADIPDLPYASQRLLCLNWTVNHTKPNQKSFELSRAESTGLLFAWLKVTDNFEVDQKRMKCIYLRHLTLKVQTFDLHYKTVNRYTTNSRPIFRRQSMVNVLAECWPLSTKISADSQSICQPELSRYLGWYRDIIGQYVNRYIGQGVHKIHMIPDVWEHSH